MAHECETWRRTQKARGHNVLPEDDRLSTADVRRGFLSKSFGFVVDFFIVVTAGAVSCGERPIAVWSHVVNVVVQRVGST